MSDSDNDKKDPDDQTAIGGGPPAAPKLPGAPAREPDSTLAGGAPPLVPPRAPAPGAPPTPSQPAAPAARPPAADAAAPPPADDEEKTVIVTRDTSRPRVSLSRVEPPGHPDTVALGTRDVYLLGRAPTSDLRLYSPAASREHARLVRRGDAWFLAPVEGKTVLANGSLVREEVRLEHKMRLRLGDDELLVIDEAVAVQAPAAAAPASAARRTGRWWIVGAVIATAIIAAAAWVLARG